MNGHWCMEILCTVKAYSPTAGRHYCSCCTASQRLPWQPRDLAATSDHTGGASTPPSTMDGCPWFQLSLHMAVVSRYLCAVRVDLTDQVWPDLGRSPSQSLEQPESEGAVRAQFYTTSNSIWTVEFVHVVKIRPGGACTQTHTHTHTLHAVQRSLAELVVHRSSAWPSWPRTSAPVTRVDCFRRTSFKWFNFSVLIGLRAQKCVRKTVRG